MSGKLNAAIAAALGGCGLASASCVFADSLSGTWTDSTGTATTSGSTISQNGNIAELTLGLRGVSNGYNGDIANGILNAYAAGGGGGSGSSSITYSTTVTNTGSSAAPFVMSINLSDLQLTAVNQYGFPDGTGTATASIGADVAVNGTDVWSSSAALSTTSSFATTYTNNNPYTFTSSGAAFASPTIANVYLGSTACCFDGTPYETATFGTYSNLISLGTLNPGQSENVTYTLSAGALISVAANNPGFDGYGGAVATIGDPFGVQGSPAFQVEPAPVPLPGTLAMMGAGLAMVAGMTRRRRVTPTA